MMQIYKGMIMKKIILLSALLLNVSFADWFVETQDDIFSGKKNAMLIGDLQADDRALLFECDGKLLSLHYLEPFDSNMPNISFKMLFKIDENNIHEFEGDISQRNNKITQITAYVPNYNVKVILNELANAKNKIIVGIAGNAGQISLTGNVRGSTKAVQEFAKICEIDITDSGLLKDKQRIEKNKK